MTTSPHGEDHALRLGHAIFQAIVEVSTVDQGDGKTAVVIDLPRCREAMIFILARIVASAPEAASVKEVKRFCDGVSNDLKRQIFKVQAEMRLGQAVAIPTLDTSQMN